MVFINFLFFLICFIISGCDISQGEKGSKKLSEPEQPYIAKDLQDALTKGYSPTQGIDALVKTGMSYWKEPGPSAVREKAKEANKNGGGRSGNWIEDTFKQDEDAIEANLSKLDGPSTFSIDTIDKLYNGMMSADPPDQTLGKPMFVLVKGLGVNYLNQYPLGKDAILQLASQYNYLESKIAQLAPVLSYLYDNTQGPQGSIEAAAAALWRTAAVKAGKLPHALTYLLPAGHERYYKNGYFEPFKISESEQLEIFKHMKAKINEMLILPQWVQCEVSGAVQLQVFSAAPSYQGSSMPEADSAGAQLCELLVAAQYEAIAKLAVMLSYIKNDFIPLHLTLVGQSAFRNPPSVMKAAFAKVAEVVNGHDKVQVFIHGFGAGDQKVARDSVDPGLAQLKEMTLEEFAKAPRTPVK